MRRRRPHADHVGAGCAPRHRAVRGGPRGQSQPRAQAPAFRACDGAGVQRPRMTAATRVEIANAPVSYGAFELTVGIMPDVPDGDAVLDAVASAGYAGVDLGPLGYLGYGDELASSLRRRSLALSGGFFELPFSELDQMPAALRQLGSLLDVFDAAGTNDGLKPKPTLADVGSDLRRSNPGRAATDHSLGFDDESWKQFAEGVEMAVAVCRKRGYEPTFHHETGTRIEAPWEI